MLFSFLCGKKEAVKSLLFLFIFFLLPCFLPHYYRENFLINHRRLCLHRVVDGDSLEVTWCGGERVFSLRFPYIDAPEIKQVSEQGAPVGLFAKNYLEKKLTHFVWVKVYYRGIYGRFIADVYNERGENIAEAMLRAGYAMSTWFLYGAPRPQQLRYQRLEKQARKNSLGIWQYGKFMLPYRYRKKYMNSRMKQ